MELADAFGKAFLLLVSFDRALAEIVFLSLRVSGIALLISVTIGLGFTVILELYRFPGRGVIIAGFNTMTGLPPVVVGLLVYIFLSRNGPLGFLNLLYTPTAMVIAQTILATPIVTALAHAAVGAAGSEVKMTAVCLGATRVQAITAVIKDARYAMVAAVATAFGRIMAEVGAVLIVGGNIAHYTRVMTTAIALETDRGDFVLAIALGIVLLTLSFGVNLILHAVQQKGVKR